MMIAPQPAPPVRPTTVQATRLLSALAISGLVALIALPAHAQDDRGDPVGPGIGNVRYKTRIEQGPQGGLDTDDYVGHLAAGDRLSVSVRSPFQSPLLPVIRLFDPDGIDRAADLKIKEAGRGKKRSLKRFAIDKTGRWTVRIESIFETEGTYFATFGVLPAGKRKSSGLTLGGAEPLERDHTVEAVDGSTIDLVAKWSKRAAPVEIVSIEGPSGAELFTADGESAGTAARSSKRSAKLKKFPLEAGDGTYTIRVRADAQTTYAFDWRVRPPKRASGRKKLSSVEPFLDPPEFDVQRGVAEMSIRLRGWNFSAGDAPRVLFGDVPGIEVAVHPSGGYLDVEVPEGVDDSTVDVTVINPDGQGSSVRGYFYYVPPPVITEVTDEDGNPVRGGDAAGGDVLRIHGQFLVSGQIVVFGESPEVVPIVRGGTLEVRTPEKDAGSYELKVTDAYEHESAAPFEFEFKSAPRFDADPYSPAVARANATTEMIVRGGNFEETDVLLFDGEELPFTFISAHLIRFEAPARADGLYVVEMTDRFDLTGRAPDLRVKAPGVIDDVAAIGGPRAGDTGISIHGGTRVRIVGSLFDSHDRVVLGGSGLDPVASAAQAIEIDAPAADAGLVDVTVVDAVDQETAVVEALRYMGFDDRTSSRAPARTAIDDLSAERGVVGDIDLDGDEDDLVIVSQNSAPGTRSVRLRLLLGEDGRKLADRTGTNLPASGSDSDGLDDWRGTDVALADIDPESDNGPEILLVGLPPDATETGEFRLFRNDGEASFTLDEDAVPDSRALPTVIAVDEVETEHVVYGERAVVGLPSALAVGDLDGDGDLDVVMGRTASERRHFGVDAAYVDFGVSPPSVSSDNAETYAVDVTRYYAATRVLENALESDGEFVDVTGAALPGIGDSTSLELPAFHARDVALGDLDDDGDLDLVVTWDDPTTVTTYGLEQGNGSDEARVATRILLNDGEGVFTDATSTWMPSSTAPEFYQGTRIAVVDLDDNGYPDLVITHTSGVDAYQGPPGFNRHALRVLTNDGTEFTDVTATALPALPTDTNENWRGDALTVADTDGDDVLDIVLGSLTAPRQNTGSKPLRATRLLLGTGAGVAFRDATGFLPPLTTDSGEANDLVLLPALAGNDRASLVLLSETVPSTSPGVNLLRVFDWIR